VSYPDLLRALAAAGVRLSIRLKVDAPAGAVTPEMRAGLAEHRHIVLKALARQAQWEALKDERWGSALDAYPEELISVDPDTREGRPHGHVA
jgi:hypothetical protein